jgi:hypothetical protein
MLIRRIIVSIVAAACATAAVVVPIAAADPGHSHFEARKYLGR